MLLKKINSTVDVDKFLHSKAYLNISAFIAIINKIQKSTSDHQSSPQLKNITKTIETISTILELTALQPMTLQRFGNAAFRLFLANAAKLIDTTNFGNPDANDYLKLAWGDPVRLDYGTGHELSFLAFLLVLFRVGVLDPDDLMHIKEVFESYLKVVRGIQTKFKLEPAGSHGVWGLDDFQFLPYIWGSGDLLVSDSNLKPSDLVNKQIAKQYSQKNLFFSAINYINESKYGPFFEHSPILFDISGVASWSKVNSGLIKMYDKEVLGKFPVIQHFYFSDVLSFEGYDKEDEKYWTDLGDKLQDILQ